MAEQTLLTAFKQLDTSSKFLLQNAAKEDDEEAFKLLASMVKFPTDETTIAMAMTLAKYWQITSENTPHSPSSVADVDDQTEQVMIPAQTKKIT